MAAAGELQCKQYITDMFKTELLCIAWNEQKQQEIWTSISFGGGYFSNNGKHFWPSVHLLIAWEVTDIKQFAAS